MSDQVMHGERVVLSTEDLHLVGPARLRAIVARSMPWADPGVIESIVADLLAGRTTH